MIGSEFDISSLALRPQSSQDKHDELGQEQFLELMIAQIQNQDPFEPIENGAFVGQLAQFSTVTGISEISKSVAALSDALLANQTIQASTMIGRSVLVETPVGTLGSDGAMHGSVELPPDAAAATIRVTDAAGQLVREFEIGGVPGGLSDYVWNGYDRNGTQAAPGKYFVEAFAESGGQQYGIPTFAHVAVVGVSIDPSGAGSLIQTEDGQSLRLTQVRAVK
jgi:flagellar basal-body rod modification protein FlgD